MHDIRAIRENPAAFDAALSRRGLSGLSSEILAVDADRVRAVIEEVAESYETPEEVISYYYGNREQLQQVEAMVLENISGCRQDVRPLGVTHQSEAVAALLILIG